MPQLIQITTGDYLPPEMNRDHSFVVVDARKQKLEQGNVVRSTQPFEQRTQRHEHIPAACPSESQPTASKMNEVPSQLRQSTSR